MQLTHKVIASVTSNNEVEMHVVPLEFMHDDALIFLGSQEQCQQHITKIKSRARCEVVFTQEQIDADNAVELIDTGISTNCFVDNGTVDCICA